MLQPPLVLVVALTSLFELSIVSYHRAAFIGRGPPGLDLTNAASATRVRAKSAWRPPKLSAAWS